MVAHADRCSVHSSATRQPMPMLRADRHWQPRLALNTLSHLSHRLNDPRNTRSPPTKPSRSPIPIYPKQHWPNAASSYGNASAIQRLIRNLDAAPVATRPALARAARSARVPHALLPSGCCFIPAQLLSAARLSARLASRGRRCRPRGAAACVHRHTRARAGGACVRACGRACTRGRSCVREFGDRVHR